MPQKQHKPLLDERGMHLTTIRGANQMRGTCSACGKPDRPLHRNALGRDWCANCNRTKKAKKK